jgi:hypothetical protein
MYVASFNGVNSYVSIPVIPPTSLNSITVAAWATIPKLPFPASPRIVDQRNSTGYVDFTLGGYIGLTGLVWGLYTGGTYHFLSAGISWLKTNTWYFVVGTWNGSMLKLYVNGQFIANLSATGSLLPTPGAQAFIGRDIVGVFWNGTIANVQIYNTALSQQEIQYLYQQGLGGGPIHLQNLVAWWPLNGDAKDYSGNNNHGTIYGGVSFIQNYNPP